MNALDINENYKNFYTNKEISHARKDNDTVGKKELLKSNNTDSYVLYTQKNSMLRKFDSSQKDHAKFHSWTESRFFLPGQIQLCLASEYPEERW